MRKSNIKNRADNSNTDEDSTGESGTDCSTDGKTDNSKSNRIHSNRVHIQEIIAATRKLSKNTYLSLFPFTFALAFMLLAIQPLATTTVIDYIDVLTLSMFILGIFIIAVLLGSIIYRVHISQEEAFHAEVSASNKASIGFSQTLKQGFITVFPMFTVVALIFGFTLLCYYFALFLIDLLLEIPAIRTLDLESIPGWDYSYIILTAIPAVYLGVYLYYASFIIVLNRKTKSGFFRRIKDAFLGSYQLVKGHWWQTACLFFILMFVYSLIDFFSQMLIQEQIILTSLLAITLQALFLPFWYTMAMSLLYALNAQAEKPLKIKV